MFPNECKYTKTHEWIREDGDGFYAVGITAYATEQIGEVTYIDLPEVGTDVKKGDEVGAVESVKAASEVYSPVTGRVVEVNDELEGKPELVNESPYELGWFYKLQDVDPMEFNRLMGAKAYEKYVSELDV